MIPFRISEMRNSSILRVYADRHRIQTDPQYQRLSSVWNLGNRQFLMDTIVNDFDIPKLYFHEFARTKVLEDGRHVDFAIIDGRQRLETIWAFIDGKFALADDFKYYSDDSVRAAGLTYADLSAKYPRLKTQIDSYSLPIMLVAADDLDYIEDMFLRLNEAVPLNAAEKRNAMGGPLTVVIRTIAAHPFFLTKVPFSNTRYQHREVAVKFLLLAHKGTAVDTKRVYLDELVREFRETDDAEAARRLSEHVNHVLSEMCSVFIDKDPLLKTQAMTVIYYLVFEDALESQWPYAVSRDTLVLFDTNRHKNRVAAETNIAQASYDLLEFDRMSLQGSNDGASIEFRFGVLRRFLQEGGEELKEIEIPCPACERTFGSFLNLARHMVLIDRPSVDSPFGGPHAVFLEELFDQPFKEFGWGKDAQIASRLRETYRSVRSWDRKSGSR